MWLFTAYRHRGEKACDALERYLPAVFLFSSQLIEICMNISLREPGNGVKRDMKSTDYFKLCVTYYAATKSVLLSFRTRTPLVNLFIQRYTRTFKPSSGIDSIKRMRKCIQNAKVALKNFKHQLGKLFTALSIENLSIMWHLY